MVFLQKKQLQLSESLKITGIIHQKIAQFERKPLHQIAQKSLLNYL